MLVLVNPLEKLPTIEFPGLPSREFVNLKKRIKKDTEKNEKLIFVLINSFQ